jgi:hypothetical protein
MLIVLWQQLLKKCCLGVAHRFDHVLAVVRVKEKLAALGVAKEERNVSNMLG